MKHVALRVANEATDETVASIAVSEYPRDIRNAGNGDFIAVRFSSGKRKPRKRLEPIYRRANSENTPSTFAALAIARIDPLEFSKSQRLAYTRLRLTSGSDGPSDEL